MNRNLASALMPLILITGCGREGPARNGAEPSANAAVVNNPEGKEKTSVMRPDVVAETEEAKAPEPPPAPRRAIVHLGGSDEGLSAEAQAVLDALLTPVVLGGTERIVIRGHSDSRGSDAANLRVSRARAGVVRDYLLSRGVAAERMEVIALGETRPVAPNARPDGSDDPEGRARNRRVEVEIVAPPTAAPSADAPAPPIGNSDQPSS